MRVFLASPTEISLSESSPALDEGFDVLERAGMLNVKAVTLLLAAERDDKDPAVFARHLVTLAKAVQG